MKKIGLASISLFLLVVFFVVLIAGCSKKIVPQSVREQIVKEAIDRLKTEYMKDRAELLKEIHRLRQEVNKQKQIKIVKIKEDRTDLIEMIKVDIDTLKDRIDEYK